MEILKTLYRGADVIILDEPTAVLTPQETKELFQIMKALKSKGKAIIFITHNHVINLLWKTTIGYEIRAVGLSPSTAKYGGISPAKKIVLAMAISGMLDALAGVERILGFDEAFGFNNCTVSTRSNAPIYLYYDCVSGLCRKGKATCCAWKTFW